MILLTDLIMYNELSQKPGLNLYQSRHCSYITYSVKTWVLKILSVCEMMAKLKFYSREISMQSFFLSGYMLMKAKYKQKLNSSDTIRFTSAKLDTCVSKYLKLKSILLKVF